MDPKDTWTIDTWTILNSGIPLHHVSPTQYTFDNMLARPGPYALDKKEELDKGDWIITKDLDSENPSILISSKNELISYKIPSWLMDIIQAEKKKATVKARRQIYSAMKHKKND